KERRNLEKKKTSPTPEKHVLSLTTVIWRFWDVLEMELLHGNRDVCVALPWQHTSESTHTHTHIQSHTHTSPHTVRYTFTPHHIHHRHTHTETHTHTCADTHMSL